jgi:molybdate transport system regulatory protein
LNASANNGKSLLLLTAEHARGLAHFTGRGQRSRGYAKMKTKKAEKGSAKAAVGRQRRISAQGPLSRANLVVRIKFPAERQLGPGKIDLLEGIERTGSISAAARDMDMSYRRAWLLVDELSHLFSRPVVTRSTGGSHGGGAQLTDFGRALVAAFRRIEVRTMATVREELAAFESDFDAV